MTQSELGWQLTGLATQAGVTNWTCVLCVAGHHRAACIRQQQLMSCACAMLPARSCSVHQFSRAEAAPPAPATWRQGCLAPITSSGVLAVQLHALPAAACSGFWVDKTFSDFGGSGKPRIALVTQSTGQRQGSLLEVWLRRPNNGISTRRSMTLDKVRKRECVCTCKRVLQYIAECGSHVH